MTQSTVHRVTLYAVVTACLAFALIESRTLRGQTQKQLTPSNTTKPTSKTIGERRATVPPESLLLTLAATRNEQLQTEMKWIFGGKEQRGWHLYKPLIHSLIAVDRATDTIEFAAALSRWQKKTGLRPTGILDEKSLYAMIGYWQSVRLKGRDYPSPEQLTIAPITDFYYPSRPEELRQVERETYAAYRRMIMAAASDPALKLNMAANEKFLKIISSFRSREYQEKLRRESPKAGRAGLAVNSPHFTGRALDIYVGGEPVETKDSNRAIQIQTPVYLWLVQNAHRFGFRPYFYEPWHWEYVR